MNDYTFDGIYLSKYSVICGIDEAGRGCLCGPVCAAAVILPDGFIPEGVDDSKKLTPKKREEVYKIITENAVSYCSAFASPEEIDEYNILGATMLAMKRAVDGLTVKPNYAIVDGNRTPKLDIPCECVVKGDAKSIHIASASIIAKVTRDCYMTELSEKYPQYGLDIHKGYPTPEHYKRIRENGICEIYRKTFLKKMH